MKYLIRSFEHELHGRVCWWRPDELGYTDRIDSAGRYTKERAKAICKRANQVEVNEKMVPEGHAFLERPLTEPTEPECKDVEG